MGINTPAPEHYGALTKMLAPERPVLGAPARIIHMIRNGIFSLPLLDRIEGVADTII